MFENIPTDLIDKFNALCEIGNILCFKTIEDDNFKIETIYYQFLNGVGTLKKITDLNRNTSCIDYNYLLLEDIDILLESINKE